MSSGYRISDLPIGKTKAYEEIRAGRLRAVKCGRATIITHDAYEAWLNSLPPASLVVDAEGGGMPISERNRKHARRDGQ
jgi:hypothetical protein